MRHTILTGAGFSHNFGGFLADEIKHKLLNSRQICRNRRLYEELVKTPNYELLIGEIESCPDRSEDLDLMMKVLEEVFEAMDLSIKLKIQQGSLRTDVLKVVYSFVHKWLLHNVTRGMTSRIFTLNQDLLLERTLEDAPMLQVSYAGFSNDRLLRLTKSVRFFQYNSGDLSKSYVFDPADWLESEFEGGIRIVKLHGSMNWRNEDDAVLIAGTLKEQKIRENSLLDMYQAVFIKELTEGPAKTLVIGYGFGDQHINDVLAKSLQNSESEVVIVGVNAWEGRLTLTDIANRLLLETVDHGFAPVESRVRHYNGTLTELFETRKNLRGMFGDIGQELR